jgi:hypothetical protein
MRCHVFVIDSSTYRTRYCKYSAKFFTRENQYCHIHGVSYLNKYCIKIQSVWKGFKTRKKLKNLFNNLPRDIQRKIIYYISEDQYYTNYYNKIRKFIYLRIHNFLYGLDYNLILYYRGDSLYEYLTPEEINIFGNILYLVNKYNIILEENMLCDFVYVCKNFYKIYKSSNKTVEWNYVIRYLKILNKY